MRALSGTTSLFSAAACWRTLCASGPRPSRSSSLTLATNSTGFDVRNCVSRSSRAESGSSYVSPRIGLPRVQSRLAIGEDLQPPLCFRAAGAGRFFAAFDHPLDGLHVGQQQLRIDRFNIAQRINAAIDVDDVFIFIAADHVQHGIDVPQIAQELIAEAFALRRAAHQAGNIHQLKNGRDDFLGFDVFIDRGQPRSREWPRPPRSARSCRTDSFRWRCLPPSAR